MLEFVWKDPPKKPVYDPPTGQRLRWHDNIVTYSDNTDISFYMTRARSKGHSASPVYKEDHYFLIIRSPAGTWGTPLRPTIEDSKEDALDAYIRYVRMSSKNACWKCSGDGWEWSPKDIKSLCECCGGRGYVRSEC